MLVLPRDPQIPPAANLRVDGDGRLYLFPQLEGRGRRPAQPRARVFLDGELIGSGYLNRRPVFYHWQVASSGRVFGVRVNPASEEWELVRYRLETRSGAPDTP